MPRISQAPATAGRTGTAASRTTIATWEACASSLSAEATPPRVASRRQRSEGPTASSSASTAGHSERVSETTGRLELELAAGQHHGGAVLADRARDEDAVAGAQRARRERPARIDAAEPGRRHVHRVALATLDDLGVARDDLDARRRRGGGDRLDLGAQVVRREPLFEHQRERQRERAGAGHRQVVDGAVDGELADRPAGEADRLDDEAVRRHGEPVDHPGVAELS